MLTRANLMLWNVVYSEFQYPSFEILLSIYHIKSYGRDMVVRTVPMVYLLPTPAPKVSPTPNESSGAQVEGMISNQRKLQ
jgi:hypothetical protein